MLMKAVEAGSCHVPKWLFEKLELPKHDFLQLGLRRDILDRGGIMTSVLLLHIIGNMPENSEGKDRLDWLLARRVFDYALIHGPELFLQVGALDSIVAFINWYLARSERYAQSARCWIWAARVENFLMPPLVDMIARMIFAARETDF